MPVKLHPGEMAFYPQPFVESEPNLLVITNQRIIHFGDGGRQEIAARDVSHVGRVSRRPFLPLAIGLAVVGLPLVVVGVYLFLSVRGLAPLSLPGLPGGSAPAAAPPATPNVADDPSLASPAEDDAAPAEASAPRDPATTRIVGIALGVGGLLLLAGAVLSVRERRHFVIVRGGTQVVKLRAGDKMLQNQIIMTVQAAQTGARAAGAGGAASAAAPRPPAPRVQVDDKGDPVKALQELAAARQAGRIPDDEFQAKREVLLERLKQRG